jgi:hypothetical protein
MGGTLLMKPLSFVMERKMLKVIKALAESSRSEQRAAMA